MIGLPKVSKLLLRCFLLILIQIMLTLGSHGITRGSQQIRGYFQFTLGSGFYLLLVDWLYYKHAIAYSHKVPKMIQLGSRYIFLMFTIGSRKIKNRITFGLRYQILKQKQLNLSLTMTTWQVKYSSREEGLDIALTQVEFQFYTLPLFSFNLMYASQ